jgi:hypothetical protein
VTTADDQLLQFVVLLKRQYLLTEHSIKRGQSQQREFENAVKSDAQTVEHVLDVMNFAFSLIDNLVKYQKIARSIPKLNQKSKEFRTLISSLGEITEIRNQHQHINRHALNKFTGPLLGSVSWVNDGANFIASFNDVGRQRSVPGMVFDIEKNSFTHNFCYVFGEVYHDLQKAIDGMRSFNVYLDKTVIVSAGGVPFSGDEHFLAMRAQFILPEIKK